jgi:hypothetical protein
VLLSQILRLCLTTLRTSTTGEHIAYKFSTGTVGLQSKVVNREGWLLHVMNENSEGHCAAEFVAASPRMLWVAGLSRVPDSILSIRSRIDLLSLCHNPRVVLMTSCVSRYLELSMPTGKRSHTPDQEVFMIRVQRQVSEVNIMNSPRYWDEMEVIPCFQVNRGPPGHC